MAINSSNTALQLMKSCNDILLFIDRKNSPVYTEFILIYVKERYIMLDKKLKSAALLAIEKNAQRRVIPFIYNDINYYIKRRMSNGRNTFAKSSPDTAFYREAYKMLSVNEAVPLAPPVVLLCDDFIVTEDTGTPLQVVAKRLSVEESKNIFFNAGHALATLHSHGFWHGRPAIRDITWHGQEQKITFLDWENKVPFLKTDPQIVDLFLFLQSCFREEWPTNELIDSAVSGYLSLPSEKERFADVRAFIQDHSRIFAVCRVLSVFHWIDVLSVDMTASYVMNLSNK